MFARCWCAIDKPEGAHSSISVKTNKQRKIITTIKVCSISPASWKTSSHVWLFEKRILKKPFIIPGSHTAWSLFSGRLISDFERLLILRRYFSSSVVEFRQLVVSFFEKHKSCKGSFQLLSLPYNTLMQFL